MRYKILAFLWPWGEINRLRRDCAEAYQIVGFLTLPMDACDLNDQMKALDNLSAAAQGEPRPHDDLLPWPKNTSEKAQKIARKGYEQGKRMADAMGRDGYAVIHPREDHG